MGVKLFRGRLQFPGSTSPQPKERSESHGATLELPCGYSVVLLHSKLASNAWLTQDLLMKRLADLVPRGVLELQVVLAGGQLLPDFDVEISFKLPQSRESNVDDTVMHCCAQDGICQIEGVPLKAEMRMIVRHPVLETQELRLVLTHCTARVVLAGDAVVRLWCIDRAGGSAVFIADYVQQNNGIPSSARPLRGQVELASGEVAQIDGVFRVPWRGATHHFEGVQVLPVDGKARTYPTVFGCDVTGALCCQIPSSGLVRSWLPVKPAQPEEVLLSQPCGAILMAIHDVISKMETNFEDTEGTAAGEPEPEQEMDPAGDAGLFAELLEKGVGLVSTFLKTASQLWKVDPPGQRSEAEDVKSLAAAMDDPHFKEVVRICDSACATPATQQFAQELRLSEAASARDSLAKTFAAAYVGAASMKPWLEAFCREVADATGAEVDEARLAGASGSTRVLQKICVLPELSPSSILSCHVRCQSMEDMAKVIGTICEKLEGHADRGIAGITLHFLDEDGQIPADSEPSDVGSVVLRVASRKRPSHLLQVAEVHVVNVNLQKPVSLTAEAAKHDLLAELQERMQADQSGHSGDFPNVTPIAAMRRLAVEGYHPAVPHHHLQSRSMKDILVRGSFEIAMLRAPEAQLQVVMPQRKIPLAAVKVESADRRQVQTSQDGWCTLALRPGDQKLRLRHDFLGSWKEQSVKVSSLTPLFQIPMAMELDVWMTPILVAGQVRAWEYWIGGCGKRPRKDSLAEPFSGRVWFSGQELDVNNGVLVLGSEPVRELHEQNQQTPPGTEQDPLLMFDLEPPFAKTISRGSPGVQSWDPRLLGVRPAAPLPTKPGAASLVVKACTICCGQPVAGIQIDLGKDHAQSITDRTGGCALRDDLCEAEMEVFAYHAAFMGGCCQYTVTSQPKSAGELPLFLQPLVRVFTVPGPSDQLVLQVLVGDGDSVLIPADAEPFAGTICDGRGEELLTSSASSAQDPDAILPSQLRTFPEAGECPIICLAHAQVKLNGYEWLPSAAFTSGTCAYEELLRVREPRTIGHLRPVVHVRDICEETWVLPLEDCRTVEDAAVILKRKLRLGLNTSLSLAAESTVPEISVDRNVGGASLLKGSALLSAGQQLKIMARLLLHVTFGNTTLGAPNVQVALRGSDEITTTDSAGVCELIVPAGRHHVLIDHGMSNEGSDEMEIDVSEVESRVEFSVPACLFVYLQAPDSEKGAAAPTNVWLCANQEHLPLTAWPVAGTLLLSDQSGTLEAPLDGETLRSVDLSNALEGKRGPLTLSLALDLSATGYVWRQKSESLLGTQSAWKRLLEKPMSVGRLFPPISVHVHFTQMTSVIQVAAFDCQTAGKLCEVMAKRFRKAASTLGVFSDQKRVGEDAEVLAWTSVDMWALAETTVLVRAPCCLRGLSGATVCVYLGTERESRERHGNGQGDSGVSGSPWAEGVTGADGRCELMVPDEVHRVEVCHPMLGRQEHLVHPKGAEQVHVLEIFPDPLIQVYSMPVSDKADEGILSDDDAYQQVWISAATELPPEARGAEVLSGTLLVDGMDGAIDASVPAKMPWRNSRLGDPCPLQRLRVDTSVSKTGPLLAFSKRVPNALGPMSCMLASLVDGPARVGALLPAVLVHVQGVQGGGKNGRQMTLTAPVRECPTALALRTWLGNRLSRDPDDLGVYHLSQNGGFGPVLSYDMELSADQELLAAVLSPIQLQVLLPDAQEEQGLSGVIVEVDGVAHGSTEADGCIQLMLPHGKRAVFLRHPSFGCGKSQSLSIPSRVDCFQMFADVRLYIYATDPDIQEEEEDGHQPSLVWVCASQDHIPSDALGIAGSARAYLADGQEISLTLNASQPSEFVVLSGDQVAGRPACSLTQLQIEASRTGFAWQPKDPSPLAERLQELGGSEYLRLLNCPVAMGCLQPTAHLHLDSGKVISFSISDYPTVEQLRDMTVKKMGSPAASVQLELAAGGSERPLDDGENIRPGWVIRACQMILVHISVVTSCCDEPIGDVSVTMAATDNVAGCTDASGSCQLMVPLGECRIHLQHASFGEMRQLPLKVTSDARGKKVCYRMKPRFFVYATDPEEQEEEEDPDACEDSGPLWDASCLWLAASEGQIPEDAIAVHGSATCVWPSAAARLRARLRADQIVGFELGPTGSASKAGSHENGVCPVSSLMVSCTRRGYNWKAKDPSPLAERTAEIGGCEALRLLACPVVLGFLEPRVMVHFADRPSMPFSLSEYSEADELRARLSEEVADDFVLRTVQRSQPISCRFLSHCDLLCATPDDMPAALASMRRFEEMKSAPETSQSDPSATTMPFLDLKTFPFRLSG
ncbi:unnamed protein product [Symbiodinium natans]|uniref:Uncharacterized protein n=1 Tax=Symbiodinium natans TaxID=878477 RepID=A0A812JK91_9DINO|nr:unnamed protein product [Symbiodinium natans]